MCHLEKKKADEKTFQAAIQHYLAALKEAKFEQSPVDVAMIQLNVSNAYLRLGQWKSNVKNVEQSIDLCQQSLTFIRRAHHAYPLATALCDLGLEQLTLGHLKGNDPRWLKQARTTLKESLATLPKDQNPVLWAQTKNNMSFVSSYLAAKTLDKTNLLEAVQACDDIQTVNRKAELPFLWAQAAEHKGMIYYLLACAYGDVEYAKSGIESLNEGMKILDQDKTPVDWVESNSAIGCNLMFEGWRTKDVNLLSQAMEKIETAVSLAEKASLSKCDYEGSLCEAYSDFLSLKDDGYIREKSELLLKIFEEKCEKPKDIDSKGEHWMNTARLQDVLARQEKDIAKIKAARTWAVKAVKVLKEGGYVFYQAEAEMILGDIDNDLGDASQAIGEYSAAKRTLKSYSPYWKTYLDEKIQRARAHR